MKKPSPSTSDDTQPSPGDRQGDDFDRVSGGEDDPGPGTRPFGDSTSDVSSAGTYQADEAIEYDSMVDLTREGICRVIMACRERQADGGTKRVVVVCGQPLQECRQGRHRVKSLTNRNRAPPRFYMPYYSGKGGVADGLLHGPTCTAAEMAEYRKASAAELEAAGAILLGDTAEGSGEESERSGELSDSEASVSVQRMGRQLLAKMDDSRREALATPGPLPKTPPEGTGARPGRRVFLVDADRRHGATSPQPGRGNGTPRAKNPSGVSVGEGQPKANPLEDGERLRQELSRVDMGGPGAPMKETDEEGEIVCYHGLLLADGWTRMVTRDSRLMTDLLSQGASYARAFSGRTQARSWQRKQRSGPYVDVPLRPPNDARHDDIVPQRSTVEPGTPRPKYYCLERRAPGHGRLATPSDRRMEELVESGEARLCRILPDSESAQRWVDAGPALLVSGGNAIEDGGFSDNDEAGCATGRSSTMHDPQFRAERYHQQVRSGDDGTPLTESSFVKALLADNYTAEDPSVGDKTRIFGMLHNDMRTFDGKLCPPGMSSTQDRAEIVGAAADVAALPGGYFQGAVSLASEYGEDLVLETAAYEQVTAITQALLERAGGGGAGDATFRRKQRNSLEVIKIEADLLDFSGKLCDAWANVKAAMDDRIRTIMLQRHYSTTMVDYYMRNGLLPRLLDISYNNFRELVFTAVTLWHEQETGGGDWKRSMACTVVSYHATKLLALRQNAASYRSFVLQTYVYLREARSTEYVNMSSMFKKAWTYMTQGPSVALPSSGGAIQREGPAVCAHCRRAGTHPGTSRSDCYFQKLSATKARDAVRGMSATRVKMVGEKFLAKLREDPDMDLHEVLVAAKA